jgi:hypothetical protein
MQPHRKTGGPIGRVVRLHYPNRASVGKRRLPHKELGFIYKGQPVDSESITSVQVCIWNAGTKSIKDGDVLEPLRLVMPTGVPILSIRVKKTARPVCGFERLDNQEDYKLGTCRLKWRILEPGDGPVLQIIYAGSARQGPTLEGAVEGQRDGIVVEHYSLNFSGTAIEDYIPMTRLRPIIGLVLLTLLLFFIAIVSHQRTEAVRKLTEEKAAAEKQLAQLRKKTVPVSPFFWILFAGALLCLFGVVTLVISSARVGPPFGW